MILILGKNGQVARALQEMPWNARVITLGSTELNMDEPNQITKVLDRLLPERPQLVLNAAAYTAVDKAETERERAFRVNSEAVRELGMWCAAQELPIVHFSTDYVYPGTGDTPWTEDDVPGPQNVYGESKLAGDLALLATEAPAYIFRISWVFSPFGHNFVKTMLRLGNEHSQLKIVADQFGSPMSALQIASLVHRAFAAGRPAAEPGIYNLSSAPFVSWHGFSKTIFEEARTQNFHLQIRELIPIKSADYPTPAARPYNSRMSDGKFRRAFGFGLDHWREGLQEILRRLA